jgi:uncharacterized membrane protein YbaN (DUF454 family)
MRVAFLLLGFVFLLLAGVGAVLPVMPSTIFVILAAASFARSSPRIEAKLLADPRTGPVIRAWRERGAIAPRAKMLAVSGMAIGFGILVFWTQPNWIVSLLAAAALAASAAYVLTRPDG